VRIVDAASGEVKHRILHSDGVRGLAWHPHGQMVATGGADFNGYLWSLRSPESPLRVFSGHQSSLTEVVFHPNGQLLLSGSWDGTTRLWDTATGYELARLVGGGGGMQFSPDGKFLAFHPTPGTTNLELYELAATRAVRFLNEDDASPENAPAAKRNPGWWS